VIVGLSSTGLHANGYSLVRSLVAQWDLDLTRPYQEQLHLSLGTSPAAAAIRAEPEYGLATLGEVLLAPTRIYARSLLALREVLVGAGHDIRGLAHITGGGLPGNVARALPGHLGARLDPETWRMPSIMRLMGALGGLDDEELRATFNGGLGMIVVVRPDTVTMTIDLMAADGIDAAVVGAVVSADELAGKRYAEGRLP
jgi:phosphoribosylformylglycinamidine cyclo-ligase